MVDNEGRFLEFRSADYCKMHFSWIFFLKFRVLLGVLKKSCARKIHTTFLYACLEVSKPKRKTNR